MNPDLPRLIPGIVSIFEPLGYVVNVTEVSDQISITLTNPFTNVVTGPQLYPYPAVNRDLSAPLLSWRASLQPITQP